MFLHITDNELCGWPILSLILICFLPTVLHIISLTNLKPTQTFLALILLFGFAENQIFIWVFKIRNSFQITKGSDNGDLDNRGSTVVTIHDHMFAVAHLQ